MKKQFIILTCLIFCFFTYLVFRTEKTLVNVIIIKIISYEAFISLRLFLKDIISLHYFAVYALPEALWVFCITQTSKDFYLKLKSYKLKLVYFPVAIVLLMEILQLCGITKGRFDIWDIVFSLLFWGFGIFLYPKKTTAVNFLKGPLTSNRILCLLCYLIVYLAHVI